jgi:RNA polymerase sigma-70 factor (ECF subfamily)
VRLSHAGDPFLDECLTHFDGIFRYVRACVRNISDAEDITQDVFAQALAHRQQFDGQNLAAWLFQMARNAVTKSYRRRAMERRNVARVARTGVASTDPSQQAEDGEAHLRAIAALDQLSETERDALRLKFATAYDSAQIARMLNVTPAHFNVIVFRALKKLRHTMVDKAGGVGGAGVVR